MEYTSSRTIPNISVARYRMLRSLALLVLHVFTICGTALAHTTNEPVVPRISNTDDGSMVTVHRRIVSHRQQRIRSDNASAGSGEPFPVALPSLFCLIGHINAGMQSKRFPLTPEHPQRGRACLWLLTFILRQLTNRRTCRGINRADKGGRLSGGTGSKGTEPDALGGNVKEPAHLNRNTKLTCESTYQVIRHKCR